METLADNLTELIGKFGSDLVINRDFIVILDSAIRGRYKHFKGDYYIVNGVAVDCDSESYVVIYRSEKTGITFTRDIMEFFDRVIDKEEKEVTRFTKVQ